MSMSHWTTRPQRICQRKIATASSSRMPTQSVSTSHERKPLPCSAQHPTSPQNWWTRMSGSNGIADSVTVLRSLVLDKYWGQPWILTTRTMTMGVKFYGLFVDYRTKMEAVCTPCDQHSHSHHSPRPIPVLRFLYCITCPYNHMSHFVSKNKTNYSCFYGIAWTHRRM